VVSALTALPDLQQLTWYNGQLQLSDSSLLLQLTKLTSLKLYGIAAAALQHLGSLTKLQYLSISAAAEDLAAAGCPGVQELKALTSLELSGVTHIPAGVTQLTALQQLDVSTPTLAAGAGLQGPTGLTKLRLCFKGVLPESATLQLPSLRHLEIGGEMPGSMPMSFLCRCTQLRVLNLSCCTLRGPGSLVASTMLQHMELYGCMIDTADGAANPVPWQQVFPCSAQLPYLTILYLSELHPELQQTDIEQVVSCCSSLQSMYVDTRQDGFVSALTRLLGLTSLRLNTADDQQCSLLAQLTNLRELTVDTPWEVSTAGLRQLAALKQLTCLGFDECCDTTKVGPMLQEHTSPRLLGYSHAIINRVSVSVWGGGRRGDVPAVFHGLLSEVCHSLVGSTCYSTIAKRLFSDQHI